MNGRHLAIDTPQILLLDRHFRPCAQLALKPFIALKGGGKKRETPIERV